MSVLRACTVALLLPACAAFAHGADFDYRLQPRALTTDTWVVEGATADFEPANGGDIANSAFIVTGAGVVVIDTGPSRAYGEQLRAAIARITAEPVVAVYNTHHHPDHMLGNQAFADVPVYALPATRAAADDLGATLAGNLYRLVGTAMRGTEAYPPSATVAAGETVLGRHRLRLLALRGHTAADLALFDVDTGTLFTGLVFNRRTPATPDADPAAWRASLLELQALAPRWLVPAAGPPVADAQAQAVLAHNLDYLDWLVGHFEAAAARGADMAELLDAPLPERFADLALLRAEYRRSVSHLYPRIERAALAPAPAPE